MTINKDNLNNHKKRLLIIAHTPSPNLQALAEALQQGVVLADCHNIELIAHAPLTSGADELLSADAVILITPENLGYMSGALKDWFDRVYYPCLEEKQGLPCSAIIRAGNDGTGTQRALETITTGLRWRWVQEPMILKGNWQDRWLNDTHELGRALATALSEGII